MSDLSTRIMTQSDAKIAEANKLYDAQDPLKAIVKSAIALSLAEVAKAIVEEAYAHASSTSQIEALVGKFENKNDDRKP